MSNVFIDFEWSKCPDGYRLSHRKEKVTNSDEDVEVVAPNSLKRIYYRPFDEPGGDDLYLMFSKVRSAKSFLEFTQNFGLLAHYSVDRVPQALRCAKFFCDLLSYKNRPKQLAAFFKSAQQQRDIEVMAYDKAGVRPPAGSFLWFESVANIEVVVDPATGLRLQVSCGSLETALWWQLCQALAGNVNFAACRHCGNWFKTGPGTGKHVDAEFCCEQHKIRHFSLARSRSNRTRTEGD
jgi:hypothetical protein